MMLLAIDDLAHRKTPDKPGCWLILALIVIQLITVTRQVHGLQTTKQVPGTRPPDITAEALTSFLDEFVPGQLQRHHIPGATISVVHDGKTVFAKGYGLARLDEQVPVDANRTLFRIASLTKLFTWTAVMQQVERGQLDLDADINQYLSAFQIPATWTQPITLRDLMTHSAGFEDRGLIGTLARNPNDPLSLKQFLIHNMPARVRPPGDVSAYSNYGGALAGHIVSQTSGVSWQQYIEERILVPLGMDHATADQVPTTQHRADLASAYTWERGDWQVIPYSLLIPMPEGGINASATSMASFMIAHLEGGRCEGGRILGEQTARQMQQQLFTHHPGLSGWAYGFEEKQVNGYRVLQHGGSLGGFVSLFVLVPEQRLGLFVSWNSSGGSRANHQLRRQFFDTFLPPAESSDVAPAIKEAVDRPESFQGVFAPCRSARTTMARLGVLVQAARLTTNHDGSVGFLDRNWSEIKPDLLTPDEGEDRMAVRRDASGDVKYVLIDSYSWQRLAWYESPVFHLSLLVFCLLTFVSAIVGWPVAYLLKRRSDPEREPTARSVRLAQWVAYVNSVINVVFVVALGVIMSGDTTHLEFGIPLYLRLLLILPVISALTTPAIVILWLANGRNQSRSRWSRIHYNFVVLASVASVWFLAFWNLIGWRF